jgi:hypothetical protein
MAPNYPLKQSRAARLVRTLLHKKAPGLATPGAFPLEPVEWKRRIVSFVATHWSHVPLVVIIGIVALVPTAVAGYGFVRFLRELFHKPPGQLDA